MELNKDKRLLFIGDSITEWGRSGDFSDIGTGYVKLIQDYLICSYPDKCPEILNRGVGGDRIINLQSRWSQDVIELTPDFLSISIGINDVWRQLDYENEPGQVTPEVFEEIYVDLLNKVYKNTNTQIILMEPTIIEEDIQSKGNLKLRAYVEIVRKLAINYQAIYVPTHGHL